MIEVKQQLPGGKITTLYRCSVSNVKTAVRMARARRNHVRMVWVTHDGWGVSCADEHEVLS